MNVKGQGRLAGVLVVLAAMSSSLGAEAGKCKTPAHECEQQLRSILADKMYLGVTLAPGRWGTIIMDVDEESPAERAGLDSGDRIIGINGHDCRGKSPSQIKRYLNPPNNGRDVSIVVVRLGELLRLHARLAPLPPERIERIVANHLAKQHDDSEGH